MHYIELKYESPGSGTEQRSDPQVLLKTIRIQDSATDLVSPVGNFHLTVPENNSHFKRKSVTND